MQTLSRQLRRPHIGGEPLPAVFPELSAIGADARRGEVLMLVGQPASGKSLVALWMCLTWLKHGYRGIYWSADATVRPAASRVLAMWNRQSVTEAEQLLDNRHPETLATLDDLSRK